MPIEFEPQLPADLNETYPLGTDSPIHGDDHLRLIKYVIKNTFGSLDEPLTKDTAFFNDPVYSGLIVMWSRPIAEIPTGWVLCDGTNGTPDMRDVFVYAAADDSEIGLEDRTATHQHTVSMNETGSHSHSVTIGNTKLDDPAYLPDHTHDIDHKAYSVKITDGNSTRTRYNFISAGSGDTMNTSETGGNGSHNHSGSSVNNGTHKHNTTITSEAIIPPYVALAYIMKV